MSRSRFVVRPPRGAANSASARVAGALVAGALVAGALVAGAPPASAQTTDDLVARIRELEYRQAPAELIAPHLDDASRAVRAAAVGALGRLRDARAANALARFLGEPDDSARRGALDALGLLGSRRSLPALYAALHSSDAGDRRAAVAGIGLVFRLDAGLDLEARELALGGLSPLLADGAPTVREAVALAIGFTGCPAGLPVLEPALEGADRALRWRLVYGIGMLGGDAAVPVLAREAEGEHPAPWCVEIAARFLAEADAMEAAAPLARLLRHASPVVSAAAARGLAKHLGREPDAYGPALERALATHPAWQTREEAARALASAAATDASLAARRASLERARAADPSAAVRTAAAWALVVLEPESADELLKLSSARAERHAIARALGAALGRADTPATQSEAWFALARAILAGDSPALSAALASGIAPVHAGAAYDLLASMLGAVNPGLRIAAAEALAGAEPEPPGDMVGAFAQSLASATGDEMVPARVALLALLARAKGPAATGPCQRALSDPRREVRAAATDALARLTGERPPASGLVGEPCAFPGSDLPVAAHPVIVFETTKGDVEIELAPHLAPLRVRAILRLVEAGYYTGRRLDTDPLELGAPHESDGGDALTALGLTRGLGDEPSAEPFELGTVGMPPADDDPSGGALFVTLVPTPELAGLCTAVGRVRRGLGTLDRLEPLDRILVARRVR